MSRTKSSDSSRRRVVRERAEHDKRRAELEALTELREQVVIREDGLVYRRGKPIKCLRNTQIRQMRADGESEEKIRAFIQYFDVKGE